jgi:hypothetical protein
VTLKSENAEPPVAKSSRLGVIVSGYPSIAAFSIDPPDRRDSKADMAQSVSLVLDDFARAAWFS